MPSTPAISTDEGRLEADFEKLIELLRSPEVLNPLHGAPVFYLVYPPRQALTVRRLVPVWSARLKEKHHLTLETVSLAEILWQLIDHSGRWETWQELESEFETEALNEAIRSVLRQDNAFVQSVTDRVAAASRPDGVVFFTDVELLHPFFRTRPIENALHQKVQSPVVFLYPGRRAGQYGLRFLEFYPEDPGYRSTLIGGLE